MRVTWIDHKITGRTLRSGVLVGVASRDGTPKLIIAAEDNGTFVEMDVDEVAHSGARPPNS